MDTYINKQNKPKILFHYTTQEGLMGILKEQSLWATKIQYLNDASELTKPLEIFDSFAKGAIIAMEKDDNERDAYLRTWGENLNTGKDVNLCVVSFCVNGDLLSQWRGYGVYGSAYSIGFNTDKLEKTINKNKFELHKCEYFSEQQYQKKVNDYVLKALAGSLHSKYKGEGYINDFVRMTATMKLKCFEEENEWRIISSKPRHYTKDNFNFRTGKSMIIPYFKLPIDISSIDKIIIGPCQHPDLAINSIKGLASKFNLINIDNIKVSSIPYRVF